MTDLLFLEDPYRKSATARVTAHTGEGGVVVDRSIFYARGGGQPGDSGSLHWEGRRFEIATAVKGNGSDVILVPAEPNGLPAIGTEVEQRLDWERRYGHMRIHTALHLLSVVIPLPVTGGSIAAEKGRLDFNMPQAPADPRMLEGQLNTLVTRDLPVSTDWMTDEELDANPGLVKTLSAQPPRGSGHVRLVRVGKGRDQVDLQPCGGTHVARTGEIGKLTITKIENKGKQNRRVTIKLV